MGVFNDPTSGAIYVFCVITAPLCFIATALRFWATHKSARPIGWEDWLALAALVVHLAHVTLSLIALELINGRNLLTLSPSEVLTVGKLVYALTPLFPVNQLFAKFSILFLYYRIFSISRVFVRWIYILGAVQVAYSVATFFISIFSCNPVSKGWNLLLPGKCINHSTFLAGSESVNSAVDFAMVVLAVFMIRGLKIKKADKWKLGLVFALGGLAGVIGFVKIGESYASKGPVNMTSGLWTTIQGACSVICCCAPTYRSLIPRHGRFWSRFNSSRTSSTKNENSFDSSSSDTTLRNESSLSRPSNVHKRDDWLNLDGASDRALAWTEVAANPNVSEPEIPMRSVQVQKSVDIV